MRVPAIVGALTACIGVLASILPLAAETQPWPWIDLKTPDPALALLSRVDGLTVTPAGQTLKISVEAQAPTPKFTELQLTPRIGDPKDLIFAFDVRGRTPQDFVAQVLTPVTIDAEYSDVPLVSVGVVEVYAQENCQAFSLKDNKAVECTMKPGSQQVP
ncbi:MAG: hypothetical protein ACRECX_13080 [Methyloceanibacter sp.]|uniref:hypothetical protein n=1 Tax=Methyloceanibacter sp. TaxID=1965321 RepID=UPI003D6D3BA2